ncbi:MAG: efflux RND transporter periplasmic adaptor subunit [Gammaproteobacteria bacterium]|nr:efflux RND transporter periplasmic adaptor subunit [Gammaproteobacteria bacterium]
MKHTLLSNLCLIIGFNCLFLALGACGGRGGAKAPVAASSLTVTVTQAVSRQVERQVVASGSVAAWQEASLGVELTGIRVARVLVEVGAQVRAGQVLVELDKRTLEVQARQSDASLAQARASFDLARAQASRGESLRDQNLISKSNYDELLANLAKTKAQVDSAEGERDASRLRLGFATLRAPDAGIISGRFVQPGQIVASGVELIRLISRGRLEWRAEVSEADLPRIKIGALVQLSTTNGENIMGRIRAVSPSLDFQRRTALIYVDLPQPGSFRAGMFAEGRLAVGSANVLLIPRESVVFRDGYPYVFVLGQAGRVAQRRIEVGMAQANNIEVRAGLQPSDKLVVRGAGFLGDGDIVKVVVGSGI